MHDLNQHFFRLKVFDVINMVFFRLKEYYIFQCTFDYSHRKLDSMALKGVNETFAISQHAM